MLHATIWSRQKERERRWVCTVMRTNAIKMRVRSPAVVADRWERERDAPIFALFAYETDSKKESFFRKDSSARIIYPTMFDMMCLCTNNMYNISMRLPLYERIKINTRKYVPRTAKSERRERAHTLCIIAAAAVVVAPSSSGSSIGSNVSIVFFFLLFSFSWMCFGCGALWFRVLCHCYAYISGTARHGMAMAYQ